MAFGCVLSVSAHGRERGHLRPAPPSRRTVGALLSFLILLFASVAAVSSPAVADPIKANVVAGTNGGYAQLIFSMSDFNDASVRQTGNVLIISFKTPIDISVDRLAAQAAGYVGAARRDPDGMAVRLALARKVTVNAMAVGQQYYVDLLPDTWQGHPPGLPQEVVDNLTRRARDAEKSLDRAQRLMTLEKIPPVRVHVATQPTFARYVFDIPTQISVSSHREVNGLTLTFDAPLNFDLGDVLTALPPTVGAIKTQIKDGAAAVRFDFAAKVDVRSFRDETGYSVDIVDPNAKDDAGKTLRIVLPQGDGPQSSAGDGTKTPFGPAAAAQGSEPRPGEKPGAADWEKRPADRSMAIPQAAPPKAVAAAPAVPVPPPVRIAAAPTPPPAGKPAPAEAQRPAVPSAPSPARAAVLPSPAAKPAATPAGFVPATEPGRAASITPAGTAPGAAKVGPAPPPAAKPAAVTQPPRSPCKKGRWA